MNQVIIIIIVRSAFSEEEKGRLKCKYSIRFTTHYISMNYCNLFSYNNNKTANQTVNVVDELLVVVNIVEHYHKFH